MDALQINDLSFSYQNSPRFALQNINLKIEKGEFIVLMGRSGAGKSTLTKCLNSVIPQFQKGSYSGSVEVFGKQTKDKSVYEMAEEVGLLLQDFELQLFSTNVILEVAFGLENFAYPREEIERRVNEVLKTAHLKGYEGRDPTTLSGGEKQRLALASILVLRPKILILDEPTTDLDPVGKEEIFSLIKSLVTQGFTVMVIEHESEEIFAAQRVVVLNEGRVVLQGKPEEVLSQKEISELYGIRQPQIFELFQRLNLNFSPRDIEDAYFHLKEIGYEISEEKYQLLEKEERKERIELLNIKNLEFAYRGMNRSGSYSKAPAILKDLNFQIFEGEFLGLVGANGCGKTTLIKHFNRLLEPTKGEILYRGKNLKDYKISELAKEIGYVFQNPDNQIFSHSVKEEMAFGPKNLGYPEAEIEKRIREVLKIVNLEGYEEKDPFTLTKGEKQRLAVGSVLVTEPKIIILDEPTTGLDYLELKNLMELLKKLKEKGHTIVMVTHTMWLVAEYAERAIVLKEGEIVFDGKVRELLKKENLKEGGLRVPPITKLGKKFGKTLLSVEEFLFCLER